MYKKKFGKKNERSRCKPEFSVSSELPRGLKTMDKSHQKSMKAEAFHSHMFSIENPMSVFTAHQIHCLALYGLTLNRFLRGRREGRSGTKKGECSGKVELHFDAIFITVCELDLVYT